MKRVPWLVRHDPDLTLINGIAAEIHVELDFFLQHHHQLSGVIVSAEEFFTIVQSIHVLPAATCEWFEERWPAYVVENPFPIEWIAEISKRFVIGIRRRLIGWKQHGSGNSDADLSRKRIVEEFFICAPPKRIVYHGSAG